MYILQEPVKDVAEPFAFKKIWAKIRYMVKFQENDIKPLADKYFW